MNGTGMAHLTSAFVVSVAAVVSASIGSPYPTLIFGMISGMLLGSFVMAAMEGEYDG